MISSRRIEAGALPEPPFYFPPRSGRYDTSPGLTRLCAADFGNGQRDRHLFQFDSGFDRVRANKRDTPAQNPNRHRCLSDYDPAVATTVTNLILERLTTEHPSLFSCTKDAGGALLRCELTDECLHFAGDGTLIRTRVGQRYADALDALCHQFAEDIAVVRRNAERGDWIAALHVCAPSRWAPEEKIGRTFDVTHAPVPGMERSRAAAGGLVDAMINRPPSVRFTWGIEFSDRLNLHPADLTTEIRGFAPGIDPKDQPLFLRAERQTIWGLPAVDAALFAIRVYVYDLRPILKEDPAGRDLLVAALQSMSPESRIYKGLPPQTFDTVIRWMGA